jgi:long-subunit fatty acid transport protein
MAGLRRSRISDASPIIRFIAFGMTLLASFGAAPVMGQSPVDQRLGQDEIDLQGRSSIVLGAGARGLGMGGAFLARADDATAASWNPAGLSYLLLPEISIVGAHNGFDTSSNSENSRARGTILDFTAVTFPFRVRGVTGSAQVSYQRVIPFSGTRSIDRERGETKLEAQGGFDVIAFATGWRLSRRLRIGVALNRWTNGFRQSLERPLTDFKYSRQQVDFTLRGFNTHIGIIVSPIDNLNFGAVAKTRFRGDVRLLKQRQDYYGTPGDPSQSTSNVLDRSDVTLELPAAWGVGVSWRVRSSLTISSDYTRTYWSKAWIRNFVTLGSTQPGSAPPDPMTYAKLSYPLLINPESNADSPQPFTEPTSSAANQLQADTEQLRFGIEYVIVSPRLQIPFRAGYLSDRQLFFARGKAPRFNGFTAGTGLILGPVAIDAAFLYERGSFSDETYSKVTQKTRRVIFSLIYRHTACP